MTRYTLFFKNNLQLHFKLRSFVTRVLLYYPNNIDTYYIAVALLISFFVCFVFVCLFIALCSFCLSVCVCLAVSFCLVFCKF